MRTAGLAFLFLVWLFAQERARPNYSGTWVFNPDQSKLEIPVPKSGVFRLDHRDPVFVLERTFVRQDGRSDELKLELTTGGKDNVRSVRGSEAHIRIVWDGAVLVFDSYLVEGGQKATNVVRYTLRDGGETLTADERFNGPKLKYHNLWVFNRQK